MQIEEGFVRKFFTITITDMDGNFQVLSGLESDPKIIKFFKEQEIERIREKMGGNRKIHNNERYEEVQTS